MSANLNSNGNNGKIAWGLREAAEACGLSVPYLRKQIDADKLRPIYVGKRVLIPDNELKRWLGLTSNGEIETPQSAAA